MKTKEAIIEICHGPECRQLDASGLRRELETQGYTVKRGQCRGLCLYAPVVHIGNHCIPEASAESVTTAKR